MPKGSILITGANGGLGSAFVTQFLNSPHGTLYHSIYTVRNASSAHELNKILESSPPHSYEILPLDLNSLSTVRTTAASLNARISSAAIPPICALVLNAAVRPVDGLVMTADGFESNFGVNYLANFLFVLLVLGSLDRECGRIVCISTSLHDSQHWICRRSYPDPEDREMYNNTEAAAKGGRSDEQTEGGSAMAGSRRYGLSKLLLVMFMYELQRRLSLSQLFSNISVLTLDPGGMGGADLVKRGPATTRFLWKNVMPTVQSLAVYFWPNGILRTNTKSARDLLAACFDTEKFGRYPKAVFINGSEQGSSSVESMDEEKQRQLWTDSLRLVGLVEDHIMSHGAE